MVLPYFALIYQKMFNIYSSCRAKLSLNPRFFGFNLVATEFKLCLIMTHKVLECYVMLPAEMSLN